MPTFRRGLEGFGHLFIQFDVKFPLNMNLFEAQKSDSKDNEKSKKKLKLTKEEEERNRKLERQLYEDKLLLLSRFFGQKSVPSSNTNTPRQELEAEIARLERELEPLKKDLKEVTDIEKERERAFAIIEQARKEGKTVMDIDIPDKKEIKPKTYGDHKVEYDVVPETQMPPPPIISPEQISYGDLVEPITRRQGATTEDEEEESGGHGGPGGVQCASQ